MGLLKLLRPSVHQTERLILAPATEELSAQVTDLFTNPDIDGTQRHGEHMTAAWSENEVSRYQEQWKKTGFGPYIALRKEDFKVVGVGGVKYLNDLTHQFDFFASVRPEYINDFYVEEIADHTLGEAFEIGIDQIEVVFDPQNETGHKFVKGIGFDAKDQRPYDLGDYRCYADYTILHEQFNRLRWPHIKPVSMGMMREFIAAVELGRMAEVTAYGEPSWAVRPAAG